MIFRYDELKEYIKEDFDVFSKQMGFNEKQIYPAVLDEYIYGGDATGLKHICIHIFLILNYKENNLNYQEILVGLKNRMSNITMDAMKSELNDEFEEFLKDYNYVMSL